MDITNLISRAIAHPPHAIAYEGDRLVAEAFPDAGIISVDGCGFDLERYAAKGLCELKSAKKTHDRFVTQWSKENGITRNCALGVHDVTWQGHEYTVVLVSWPNIMHGSTDVVWIVGDTVQNCEAFYVAVCEWGTLVSEEVLVFMEGEWHRSKELFDLIQMSSFDNLILPEELERELPVDIDRFLQAREVYERYRVPWKRGILLIGPPGNGKTHAVKALINRTKAPCLYVKSFKQQFRTDHTSIRAVFERARDTTPCLLVLEDLDTLLTDENRSFFLNEMDGFEANTGVIVLATTNHAERLDPAIVDRPSRFDRKYHFDLPAPAERVRYLAAWNQQVDPDMRFTDEAMASLTEATDGFSFAYLKELCLSSMMRWIADRQPGGMDAILLSQTTALKTQMATDPGPSTSNTDLEIPGLPDWSVLRRVVRRHN